MPNWCTNEIEIYGHPDDIKSFKKLVYRDNDNIFSFQNIKPMPKALDESVKGTKESTPEWQKENSAELKEKYGADNWYDWNIKNWGTKWDACAVDLVDESEETLNYMMETAWSPPDEIVDTLRNKFPELSISWFYREDGCQIAGFL